MENRNTRELPGPDRELAESPERQRTHGLVEEKEKRAAPSAPPLGVARTSSCKKKCLDVKNDDHIDFRSNYFGPNMVFFYGFV